jgi:hypothetical protein
VRALHPRTLRRCGLSIHVLSSARGLLYCIVLFLSPDAWEHDRTPTCIARASQCAGTRSIRVSVPAHTRPRVGTSEDRSSPLGAEQQDVRYRAPRADDEEAARYTASPQRSCLIGTVCICVRCSVARFEGEVHWPGPRRSRTSSLEGSPPPDEHSLLRRGLDAVGVGRGTGHSRCCSIAPPLTYVCARASTEDPEGETRLDTLRTRHPPSPILWTYTCTARIRRARGNEDALFPAAGLLVPSLLSRPTRPRPLGVGTRHRGPLRAVAHLPESRLYLRDGQRVAASTPPHLRRAGALPPAALRES